MPLINLMKNHAQLASFNNCKRSIRNQLRAMVARISNRFRYFDSRVQPVCSRIEKLDNEFNLFMYLI
jgi:hypothetical protein